MADVIKATIKAPNSIGVRLRISKGVLVTVREKGKKGLGEPKATTPCGLLTQWREWTWPLSNRVIEVLASKDADVHAIHILQPPDPRQAPKPARRRRPVRPTEGV